jgi:hypothetical protein
VLLTDSCHQSDFPPPLTSGTPDQYSRLANAHFLFEIGDLP